MSADALGLGDGQHLGPSAWVKNSVTPRVVAVTQTQTPPLAVVAVAGTLAQRQLTPPCGAWL